MWVELLWAFDGVAFSQISPVDCNLIFVDSPRHTSIPSVFETLSSFWRQPSSTRGSRRYKDWGVPYLFKIIRHWTRAGLYYGLLLGYRDGLGTSLLIVVPQHFYVDLMDLSLFFSELSYRSTWGIVFQKPDWFIFSTYNILSLNTESAEIVFIWHLENQYLQQNFPHVSFAGPFEERQHQPIAPTRHNLLYKDFWKVRDFGLI